MFQQLPSKDSIIESLNIHTWPALELRNLACLACNAIMHFQN